MSVVSDRKTPTRLASDAVCPGDGRPLAAPSEISAHGWWGALRRTAVSVFDKRLFGEAAAIAFYALLALFPAAAALISGVGLFSRSAVATQQTRDAAASLLPAGVRDVAAELLGRLAELEDGGFGPGTTVIVIAAALWGATATAAQLFSALNVAYGQAESRSLFRLYTIALMYSVGAAAFISVVLAAIITPTILADQANTAGAADLVLRLGRWLIVLTAVALGLALTYRHGPSRKCPRWQWVSWGGGLAALLWLASSAGFSWYVALSGGYGRLYGSLGAMVALMAWAWLSSVAVLLGAALNAELEAEANAR